MIDVREAAARIGVHPNTVKRIPPEELPYIRVGTRGDRRYEVEDVADYKHERRPLAPRHRRVPLVALNELATAWLDFEASDRPEDRHRLGQSIARVLRSRW